MSTKENKLKDILRLKSDAAEAKLAELASRLCEVEGRLAQVVERRRIIPDDPREQLVYDRHLMWLDGKARDLSMQAAQLNVQIADAKRDLSKQFGRKLAFDAMLEKAGLKGAKTRREP